MAQNVHAGLKYRIKNKDTVRVSTMYGMYSDLYALREDHPLRPKGDHPLIARQKRFNKEGEILYQYMVEHMDDLICTDSDSGEQWIDRFDIQPAASRIDWRDVEKVKDEHYQAIHDALVPWIRDEQKSGRLFQKDLWYAFSYPHYIWNEMFYGYRKLFFYDKFVFQLSLVNQRYMVEEAADLDILQYEVEDKRIHIRFQSTGEQTTRIQEGDSYDCIVFEVALYAAKDNKYCEEIMQSIDADQMISDQLWNKK